MTMEKDIQQCNLCNPDFYCTRTADGRRYNFIRSDKEILSFDYIAQCPLLRDKVKFVDKGFMFKNEDTGEEYKSL